MIPILLPDFVSLIDISSILPITIISLPSSIASNCVEFVCEMASMLLLNSSNGCPLIYTPRYSCSKLKSSLWVNSSGAKLRLSTILLILSSSPNSENCASLLISELFLDWSVIYSIFCIKVFLV